MNFKKVLIAKIFVLEVRNSSLHDVDHLKDPVWFKFFFDIQKCIKSSWNSMKLGQCFMEFYKTIENMFFHLSEFYL